MCVKNKIKNRLRITPTFRIHCDGVGNAAVAVCTRRTHRARRNILASLRVTPVVVGGVVGGGQDRQDQRGSRMTEEKKPGDDRSSTLRGGEKTPSWPGNRIAMTRRLSLCAAEIFITIVCVIIILPRDV